MYTPGDENELEYNVPEDSNEEIVKDEEITSLQGEQKEEEKKPLSEKIHDALQDWSNKDQADQDFDNTRP